MYVVSRSVFLVLILVPQSNRKELCLTLITSLCLLYYYLDKQATDLRERKVQKVFEVFISFSFGKLPVI